MRIEVLIHGPAATGKSALARAMRDLLPSLGYGVVIREADEVFATDAAHREQERVIANAEKSGRVVVITVTERNPS